ncbi:hypothetical protein V1460_02765 [Streptomyces sp. SCSIO 30461]|uniref:hypothetical protein n=1 Tax=Streptomyces sp. SCSIO 30461 TaxID=3118085 RepID=UPI0030CCCDC0
MTEPTTEVPEATRVTEVPDVREAPEVSQAGQGSASALNAPPMPAAPPAVPAAPAPARDRRVLRAVARWTAVVLVCGGLGAGSAVGIASMERTDVPGLATESDGRWDYPRLSLPALPQGTPRPFNEGNVLEVHHADLRKLVLPAPAGAIADEKLTGGWVPAERYLAEYPAAKRAELGTELKDHGVRHIAARAWSMPDGTSARVYLLRFDSADTAAEYNDLLVLPTEPEVPLLNAPVSGLDLQWKVPPGNSPTVSFVFEEKAPAGAQDVRHAYILAGDTLAFVIHERKGKAAEIPFHQTLVLQNQLLG